MKKQFYTENETCFCYTYVQNKLCYFYAQIIKVNVIGKNSIYRDLKCKYSYTVRMLENYLYDCYTKEVVAPVIDYKANQYFEVPQVCLKKYYIASNKSFYELSAGNVY